MIRRLLAAPILLCVALALAACGDAARFQTPIPTANPLKSARTVAQTPAAEREHERILSSYGGSYDDPKLEGLIGKTVDRLVAASDRSDQAALCDARPDRAGQRYLGIVLGAQPRDGACAGKARLDLRGPGASGRRRHPRRHRHG